GGVHAVHVLLADDPGPLGAHDRLTAGDGGQADVTARRVARVDATLGERDRRQLRQLKEVRDRVPDLDDAVVVDDIDNELNRRFRGFLDLVPGGPDELDALLEAVWNGLENDLVQLVKDRLEELLPDRGDRGLDTVPSWDDDVLPDPREDRPEGVLYEIVDI